MTLATVKKWGNSLAIRIPLPLAAQLGITENSSVSLQLEGKDRLVIERDLSIEEMLESFTEENRHELVDFGPPAGKEII
ncbi:MAG: AbrB/MazE/SpoVT family DNA-binding domain-containing protein [Chloroflexi bacterium]|nr:AbrB/MazE/SpoVT family DNA-binding domain-containing protein [Chloroflexota bacterium]